MRRPWNSCGGLATGSSSKLLLIFDLRCLGVPDHAHDQRHDVDRHSEKVEVHQADQQANGRGERDRLHLSAGGQHVDAHAGIHHRQQPRNQPKHADAHPNQREKPDRGHHHVPERRQQHQRAGNSVENIVVLHQFTHNEKGACQGGPLVADQRARRSYFFTHSVPDHR